jgi:signal transduction histidine kinase
MHEVLHHKLNERVKELTALHRTARLLQNVERPLPEVMAEVVALVPLAWQYPEIATAQVRLEKDAWASPRHASTPWVQREEFRLRDGSGGVLEVAYHEERPLADEGPFLQEERDLIRSLAEMLRGFWQHRRDHTAILQANEDLERQIASRTNDLRRLASEVCLAEARERREIASDLHDHLGQGLAFVRARLRQLQGDAVFGGHDPAVNELLQLVDQAISYTRSLTFELSPPVLYELGLGPALEWLGEQVQIKHGLRVRVRDRCRKDLPDDLRVLYFRSARELLHNVVKHAGANEASIELDCQEGKLELTVADNGKGLDPVAALAARDDQRFGLFSIEERLRQLGGRLEIKGAPERGSRARLVAPLPKETRL